ncbi:uncharacterized protein LOC141576723 [Camelus bactrianus]|uniref:Uncharacterized protein LOC141576718 n=2 Tax=Camelus bactrianus TaxID=9837 RepID=A0AC58Q1S8_CAMBA
MRCAVQIRGCPRAAGFPRGDHVSQVPPWGSRSRALGTTSSAPAPPAPIRTRGWAAEDAHLSRWRPFLSLTWTPSWAQSAQSPSSGSQALTPDTRRPCTEACVPGPDPQPTWRGSTRGQGWPRGQSPLPRQALMLDVPAPRVPPPLPRSESRLGDFLGVAATLGTGVRIAERWRPRRAYVGSGAAAQARAQPRRLCPRRGALRSRPGVTFSLGPNPASTPRPGPSSPLGKPPSRQHRQAPPGAPVLLLGQSTGPGPTPAHLQHLVLLLAPEAQGRRPLLEALAVLGPRPRGAWTSSQRRALAAAAPAEAATPPGRGGEGKSGPRETWPVSPRAGGRSDAGRGARAGPCSQGALEGARPPPGRLRLSPEPAARSPRFPPLPPPPRAERGARCGETAAGAPAGPAAAPRPREAFGVGCGPSRQGPLTCCVCTGGCAVPVSAPSVAGSVFGDRCVCGCSCRSSSRPSRPPQPHSRPRGPGTTAASAPDASSGLRPQHVHVTPAALVLQKSCALDLCHLL